MVNKYANGTVARRGDIVTTKGGMYVVVDPAHDDGSLFLATIEPPFGYTRKTPGVDCQIAILDSKAMRIALDVLSGFP